MLNKKDSILGVKIDNFSQEEILEKVSFFLDDPSFHQVATVNPEFILEAQKNIIFKKVLNSCDLSIADGFGLKLAFWRQGKNLKTRFPGADLLLKILKIAEKKETEIFLAINKNGLSSFEEVKEAISNKFPKLLIKGIDINCHAEFSSACLPAGRHLKILKQVQDDKCILFCNFGVPQQEIFINSLKCDKIRLAMGVGGSFDFLTGKIHRAPKFMRQIGLEWLWRLFLQPRRWKRIFKAVIIFPIKVMFNR